MLPDLRPMHMGQTGVSQNGDLELHQPDDDPATWPWFQGASTNDTDPTNFITFPVLRNHVSLNLRHTMLIPQIDTKNCETQPTVMSHNHPVGL